MRFVFFFSHISLTFIWVGTLLLIELGLLELDAELLPELLPELVPLLVPELVLELAPELLPEGSTWCERASRSA